MSDRENWFIDELERRGVSRREFLGFCTVMTSALALPSVLSAKVAKAIQGAEKPVLVWLEFQDCCGNTESFLRASKPEWSARQGRPSQEGRTPHGGEELCHGRSRRPLVSCPYPPDSIAPPGS